MGQVDPIPPGEVDPGAAAVIRRLQDAGHKACLAGGGVRDLLLRRPPKDWDVATDADPDRVMELFEHAVPVGAQFGIVLVRLGEGEYHVARFRREGSYADGRHPDRVEFTGPEEDARRRDFTVNGLFHDPGGAGVIDFVGGVKDLEARLIRAIGDPAERFAEDGLRTLRAVRLAASLGFDIESGTRRAIRECAHMVDGLSAERVRDELTRILVEGAAARGFELLLELGLLERVLPEVAAFDGVRQPLEHHPEGDVWQHVLLMLKQVDGMRNPPPTLAWGVLLHDVGKPPTFSESDRIRFHGHDQLGAEMVEEIARRLRFSNRDAERVRMLTAQHMRFPNARHMRPGKLKRFLRQDGFDELLELHRIDCRASHGMLDLHEFCQQALTAAAEEEGQPLRPPPLLSGHDLMALGLEPGPAFGEILRWVEDEQLEGRLRDRDSALEAVRRLWLEGA